MLSLLGGINLNIVFGVVGGVLLLMLLPKPAGLLLKLVSQGVVGVLAILGLNFLLVPFGVSIGVNLLTASVATLLGIPGVVSLFVLQAFVL